MAKKKTISNKIYAKYFGSLEAESLKIVCFVLYLQK